MPHQQEQNGFIQGEHVQRLTTPFFGRNQEIADILARLDDPMCRLLTLVGTGGIGKTSLAQQIGAQLQKRSGTPVYFVPLRPVRASRFLVSTIADAIGCSSGKEEQRAHLLNYLKNRSLFLILDNFEHLLDEVGFLSQMLAAAPDLQVLVTSREVLNLREEWLYPVQGLDYPQGEDDEGDRQDAVRLFLTWAQRVQPGFSLADNRAATFRICQLVEGMPLAVELAATWVRALPCETIAAEIQRNLDFLSTTVRNVSQHHRSIRAVFQQSWILLSQQEQTVLKQLSVFHGGFERDAAQQITHASLPVLTALVDKSLLTNVDGRYAVHELLRQYAEERLSESVADAYHVQERHCTYYIDFLHRRLHDMNGGRQRGATAEIKSELNNIRAAWAHAVEQGRISDIQRAAQTLYLFYQFQSQYQEGVETWEATLRRLDTEKPNLPQETAERQTLTVAQLLVDLGWFCIRLGHLERANALLERSHALYTELGAAPPATGMATDPLNPLGILASIRGNYTKAVDLGKKAQEQSQAALRPGQLDVFPLCFGRCLPRSGGCGQCYNARPPGL